MQRRDTLFSIRYAVRVLERHARLWGRIDATIRLLALLSGSSAFAALMSSNRTAAMICGVVFAALQAVEFAIRPAEIRAKSLSVRADYARLLAREAAHDDTELRVAYQALVADDEVVVQESLRRIAYNDVLEERGDDPAHAYPLSGRQQLIAFIA